MISGLELLRIYNEQGAEWDNLSPKEKVRVFDLTKDPEKILQLQVKKAWYSRNRTKQRARENSRSYKDFRNARIEFRKSLNNLKTLINGKVTKELLTELEKTFFLSKKYQTHLDIYQKLKGGKDGKHN